MAPPSRGSAAGPWERRNPTRFPLEREATPGGAPRAGPVVRRGTADPRWTSGTRLAPEWGRSPEVEDWRRETRGRGESNAPKPETQMSGGGPWGKDHTRPQQGRGEQG
ncbi:hypothetical protein NDU88_002849 [Pleurodeles waltl]|uniref:Uncharacterized protein n=1 Tax=Pleurodeles waltl TaxID=8319 RepID=A0AAV7NGH1_PLEWA|nr:hypothetical protein NDU88_002849 [Pleurodeles waltl]